MNKIRNHGFRPEELGESYFGEEIFRSLGLAYKYYCIWGAQMMRCIVFGISRFIQSVRAESVEAAFALLLIYRERISTGLLVLSIVERSIRVDLSGTFLDMMKSRTVGRYLA